jgi:hypothetical protein
VDGFAEGFSPALRPPIASRRAESHARFVEKNEPADVQRGLFGDEELSEQTDSLGVALLGEDRFFLCVKPMATIA